MMAGGAVRLSSFASPLAYYSHLSKSKYAIRLFRNCLFSSHSSNACIVVEHHRSSEETIPRRSSDHNDKFATASKHVAKATSTSDMKLVDELLERTVSLISQQQSRTNLVAFSGGVDSSLVAYLVHRISDQLPNVDAMAVLGISPAVPEEQIKMAHEIASWIGIELVQVRTEESTDLTYIQNAGQACFACKTHLYQALLAVATTAANSFPTTTTTLFNGTNADDKLDKTRVGLVAAAKYQVQSPLEFLTKEEVRRASRAVGLPNWNHAASPCLRSRLALGVEATSHHLKLIERAEQFVRAYLLVSILHDSAGISPETVNLRVRFLANQRAAIELDEHVLSLLIATRIATVQNELSTDSRIHDFFINELGFRQYIVRPFRSGSVSTALKVQ